MSKRTSTRRHFLGILVSAAFMLVAANATDSEIVACTADEADSVHPIHTDASEPTLANDLTSSSSSDSTLRTMNIVLGCPEFQHAFDSATPGSMAPFRSFTLTKGTGYAYVELHFSKLWVPRGVSVVLHAVEGFDVEDTKLNLSTSYPSGRAYGEVVAPPVLSKEFRLEFYRNGGSRNTTDAEFAVDEFNVTDTATKCYGFVLDSYYYVLVDDTNPLVATVESICAADNTKPAVCYYDDSTTRTAYLAARSVARLFITKSRNVFASCTGWLLGNQGHVMTNYHCVASDAEARSTTVEFMVESSKCNGTASCTWKECKGAMVAATTKLVRANEALDLWLLANEDSGRRGRRAALYPAASARQHQADSPGRRLYQQCRASKSQL